MTFVRLTHLSRAQSSLGGQKTVGATLARSATDTANRVGSVRRVVATVGVFAGVGPS